MGKNTEAQSSQSHFERKERAFLNNGL